MMNNLLRTTLRRQESHLFFLFYGVLFHSLPCWGVLCASHRSGNTWGMGAGGRAGLQGLGWR